MKTILVVSTTSFALGLLLLAAPSTSRADNIFVSNNNDGSVNGPYSIEEFSSSGVGTPFASSGLNGPGGLTFDSAGNLYVANYNGNYIEEFNSSGVGTVYASGVSTPRALAFNSAGQMFAVSDSSSVLKIVGGSGTLFASTGDTPVGAAFDKSGNLYVSVQNIPGSGGESIEKFNTNGVGTVFATGLNGPIDLAIQVPEPSTWTMVVLGIGAVLGGLRMRRRSS